MSHRQPFGHCTVGDISDKQNETTCGRYHKKNNTFNGTGLMTGRINDYEYQTRRSQKSMNNGHALWRFLSCENKREKDHTKNSGEGEQSNGCINHTDKFLVKFL